MRKQRVDVLVYILTQRVEPDYQRMEIRVALGFENSNLSKTELASRKTAEAIESGVLDEMVIDDGDNNVCA